MKVRPYTDADAEGWDELVGQSASGTFLHTRRFLSYHGGRFEDRSLVCTDEKGRLLGVFPAALVPGSPERVASHPGATYGGLVCGEIDDADRVEKMLAGIFDHYASQGVRQLEYRSVPPHLHAIFSQLDLRAIWKKGGTVTRRDLWNVVTMDGRPGYSSHHVRAIAKARKRGIAIEVAKSGDSYRSFHDVLTGRLADRYEVAPVHTVEEMLELRERFPGNIALWLARDAGGAVVAGTWLFMHKKRSWHTQYIASNEAGRDSSATHLLFDGLILEAERQGVGFVSFGRSTEDDGRRLNAGLFAFKAGFGAGAVCHDTYQISL